MGRKRFDPATRMRAQLAGLGRESVKKIHDNSRREGSFEAIRVAPDEDKAELEEYAFLQELIYTIKDKLRTNISDLWFRDIKDGAAALKLLLTQCDDIRARLSARQALRDASNETGNTIGSVLAEIEAELDRKMNAP